VEEGEGKSPRVELPGGGAGVGIRREEEGTRILLGVRSGEGGRDGGVKKTSCFQSVSEKGEVEKGDLDAPRRVDHVGGEEECQEQLERVS